MNSSEKNQKPEKKKDEKSKNTKYYIGTNNLVMNEIQELLTDQEMIKKSLIEQDDDDYALELIFPKEITQKNNEIKFLLQINKDYPNIEPELYCLTVFCHPHLCDGRNLTKNIINGEWSNKKYPLESIINKIPKFIIKYNEIKNEPIEVGKFILNKYYKINFLKNLPVFFHLIAKENKILTISDISVCLYKLDKKIGFCKLSFYVDIQDIIEVNLNSNKKSITIKYTLNNKNKKININDSNFETINRILSEKMKIYHKKSGKLPDIDIKKVEKEIEEKENELKKDNKNVEKNLYLMSLYQNAVEYYSAINNPKFIEITHKIHKLLENTQFNISSEKAKDELNDNLKNNINNEEKNISNNNLIQENKKEEKKEKTEKKKDLINKIKSDDKEKKDKNEDKDKKSEIKKEKKIKIELKKEDGKKDNKTEEKKGKEINNEIKNENGKQIKKEEKKEGDNKKASLRLKIDEGELGTLDVGDEEEEEEEDEK